MLKTYKKNVCLQRKTNNEKHKKYRKYKKHNGGNILRLKSDNLWKHIGDVIMVSKDIKWLENEPEINLKKGTYQIVEVHEHGTVMFNIKNNQLVDTEHFNDEEFISIYMDPIDRVDLLIDAVTKQSLQLSSDGWTKIKEPTQFSMDITPYLEKLELLNVMKASLILGKTKNV